MSCALRPDSATSALVAGFGIGVREREVAVTRRQTVIAGLTAAFAGLVIGVGLVAFLTSGGQDHPARHAARAQASDRQHGTGRAAGRKRSAKAHRRQSGGRQRTAVAGGTGNSGSGSGDEGCGYDCGDGENDCWDCGDDNSDEYGDSGPSSGSGSDISTPGPASSPAPDVSPAPPPAPAPPPDVIPSG